MWVEMLKTILRFSQRKGKRHSTKYKQYVCVEDLERSRYVARIKPEYYIKIRDTHMDDLKSKKYRGQYAKFGRLLGLTRPQGRNIALGLKPCSMDIALRISILAGLNPLRGDNWTHIFEFSVSCRGLPTNHPANNMLKNLGQIPYEDSSPIRIFRERNRL